MVKVKKISMDETPGNELNFTASEIPTDPEVRKALKIIAKLLGWEIP